MSLGRDWWTHSCTPFLHMASQSKGGSQFPEVAPLSLWGPGRPFISTVQNLHGKQAGARLCCAPLLVSYPAALLSSRPPSPLCGLVGCLFLLFPRLPVPSHLCILPGDDKVTVKAWVGDPVRAARVCEVFGVLSPCSPQLLAGILTLLQLEPPSSVFPGHGHLLEHLARGAFCGPLFLSGLLLSLFLKFKYLFVWLHQIWVYAH